jgi:hypothetical protein
MPLAGHPVQIAIRTDNTAATFPADEVDGANSVEYSPTLDLLDVSAFNDGQAKTKLGAMRDGSISLSGDYEPTATPNQRIVTAAGDGSSVWATVNFNPGGGAGTVGFRVECKVANFKIGAAVADRVTFSAELQFTAIPTVL